MSQEIPETPRAPRALPWVGWALVVVALLLPAVFGVVVQRVLGGALDEQYFTSSAEYDAEGNETVTTDPDVSFWDRWGLLTWYTPTDRVVVASTVVCVALAALHVAAGDRWPLPRACRGAAAVACAVSAALAGALVVVQFASTRVPDAERMWISSTDSFLDLAVPVGTSITMLVFAVAAGVALLGPPVPRSAPARRAEGPPVAEGEPTAASDDHDPPADPEPVDFPRLPAADHALYRRPGA